MLYSLDLSFTARQWRRNRSASLSTKPVEGRLVSGPQVTNRLLTCPTRQHDALTTIGGFGSAVFLTS